MMDEQGRARKGRERVTVVIPTLDEADHLPLLLKEISKEQTIIGRIIVSDGGSTDGTVAIARQIGAITVTGPPGRGGQLARAIAEAPFGWLWLLHADCVPGIGWQPILAAALDTDERGIARYGRLRFATATPMARLLECLTRARCRLFGLPYGDQGLLIHTDLLTMIGGMPDLPLMEDVALARRLGRSRLQPMPIDIIADADAYERDGWAWRTIGNAMRLFQFLAGQPAEAIAAHYRR